MTSRQWGETRAYFWELDQIPSGSPYSASGADYLTTLVPDSVEWTRLMSQIGNGRASFYATGDLSFIAPGRVCVITQMVTGYTFSFGRLLACFLIEEMEPNTRMSGGSNISVIDVRGQGVEGLLGKFAVWPPVGEEEILEAVLTVDAVAPITTALAVGAPAGNDAATCDSVAGIQEGDEVRIRMGAANDGDYHVAKITAIDPPGSPANTIVFTPDIPGDAAIDNTVIFRIAALSLDTTLNMGVNQRVEVTLNSAAVFESVITEIDTVANTVVIREGLTGAADSGKAFKAYDYSARTVSDVTQVMQNAPDWTVAFQTGNGTAAGTAHVPQGESVFDILSAIAERTGEFWRYHIPSNIVPTYTIQWRRTPDSSGITLILYDTDEHARQLADELSETKGSAFNIRRKSALSMVTRIYPSAGDQVISLSQCTNAALSYAISNGCYVTISDDFYEPDSVTDSTGVNAIGVRSIRETYGDIAITDATNLAEVQAASDQLLYSAVNTLLQSRTREYFTVEAYIPVPVKPGQTIRIENETRTTPAVVSSVDYTILEVTEMMVNGRPRTRLTVSDQSGLRRTPATIFGTTMRSTIQSLRRLTRSGGGGKQVTIVSSPGTTGDHGGLTGLGDDDHPQYLLASGARTLTGNLAVSPGVTIDGVDISALAAGGTAHSPATAGNYGISLVDQAISLKLSALTPGLAIRAVAPNEGLTVLLQTTSGLELTASGLALSDTVAGEGIKAVSKVLHLDLATNSGLLISTDKLTLGTPGALSATSATAVTGSSHTHSVSSSSNPGASSNLLKTDASGYLQLFSLGVGTTPDGASGLKVMSPAASWYGLYLKQRADQIAPVLRIESAAGQALLIVTNSGDLESGNPGFVSGLTGWQMTAAGDLEANNARIRGELHAATFVADEMHATGGTLMVATATTVATPTGATNVLGAIDGIGTTTLYVTASWATGLSYFANNDIIRIKPMGETSGGGSLYLPDIYLEVNSATVVGDRNLAQGKPGRVRLLCTRKSGGHTGFVVPTGAAVVKWTVVQSSTGVTGVYKGQLMLTSDMSQSPYLDIFTVNGSLPKTGLPGGSWPGAGDTRTPPTITPRVRVGNLDGVLGLAEQWGIAAGTDLSDTTTAAKYIVASDLGVTLRNVNLDLYSGANKAIQINPTDGIRLLNSDNVYAADRSLKWITSGGTAIGIVSAMQDASGNRFIEMGVNPTYGFSELTAVGIQISKWASGSVTSEISLNAALTTTAAISATGSIAATGDLKAAGGLSLGDASQDPDVAVMRIKEKTFAAATPPTGFAHLWIQDVAGVQKLYVKFENGVTRELATG